MERIKCFYCGEPFIPKSTNGKYCCKECYKKATAKRIVDANKSVRSKAVQKNKGGKCKMTLTEMCAEAKRLGLSYGQYMAKYRK